MGLAQFSLKKQVTTAMLILIIVIFGAVSFTKLPVDLFPELEIPYAIVSVSYQGASPQEMETLVTRPIEEALGSVSRVINISSRSAEGSSLVIVEFSYNTDMSYATLDMREKIDLIKGYLPGGISAPLVMTIDPNAQAIVMTALSGKEDLADLQRLAEDVIKPRIERLDGVASVSISGGYENVVEIVADNNKLRGYNLSIGLLAQLLGAENLTLPSGEITSGSSSLSVRTGGEFGSLADIENFSIPLPSGEAIRLSEIATVTLTTSDMEVLSHVNGAPCVSISVQKRSGTNTVSVANQINGVFAEIAQDYPDYSFDTLLDQADYINLAIDSIINNAITGAVLAMIILFLFLWNVRATVVIGISIPVSIIATFTILYLFDITLNMMTLGGLALGVGMMVDNSIVVLENIVRLFDEGLDRFEAAKKGAGEVALAITASTVTSVVIFVPVIFVEGLVASLFRELALAISISLLCSLLVALTVTPLLCYRLLKPKKQKKEQKSGGQPKNTIILTRPYTKLLALSLRHRLIAVLLFFACFVGSIWTVFTVGSELFPETDQGMIQISVSLPAGSELSDTQAITNCIVDKMGDLPEIDTVFSLVGGGVSSFMGGGGASSSSLIVNLTDLGTRERSASEVADEIRARTADIAGAEIEISSTGSVDMSAMSGNPISISVRGEDLDELKQISIDLKEIIESVEGAREVSSSLEEGSENIKVSVNRAGAARFGLTAAGIAQEVKNNLSGVTATRYKYNGTQIDVIVKGDGGERRGLEQLRSLPIPTPSGGAVPLELVADVGIEIGAQAIARENQERTVTVSGQVFGRGSAEVNAEIAQKFESYPLPAGYAIEFGGEAEEIANTFSDLATMLLLSAVLVFMVLASQFESLLFPFVIMMSVPLGLSGAFLGLFITGKALSVPAFIGLIMLCGIVVNNAIVLVDYVNTRRKEGEDRETALKHAGPIRLRPVLMTTLTTILGLIPLSLGIGDGAELMAPLAIAMIGGLTLSTLVTLVFIPVVYSVIDDIATAPKRFREKRRKRRHDGTGTSQT